MNWKEIYSSQWPKAAKNVARVIKDINLWFPDGFEIRPGHGALEFNHQNGEHEHGEPDIFIELDGNIIAGIEVTGTDKVRWPTVAWVGHHKMQYARKVGFPIAFVLFFKGGDRRFVSAGMIEHYAENPETRKIYGNLEYYHILKPHYTQEYSGLRYWVEGVLECYKFEKHNEQLKFPGDGNN